MLEWLRDLFADDPFEATYDEAAERFRERHADALERAERRAVELRTELEEALDVIDTGLAALADAEVEQDPVADVVDNVVRRRRRSLERLEIPEDPLALEDALEDFLETRSDLSRKETAALRQIEYPEQYSDAVDRFESAVDDLDDFLADERELLDAADDLDELVRRRRDRRAELVDLRDERDAIDVDEARDRLDALGEELDDLRDGPDWEEYEALRDERDDARSERQAVRSDVNAAVAKTGRGLKKLLYAADDGAFSIDADRELLEELRDGDTDAVLDRDPRTVEAAVQALRDAPIEEHVDGTDREKLVDGLDALADIGDQVERLADHRERIAELDDRIADHGAPEREAELRRAIEEARSEVDRRQSERKRLGDRIEEVEDEIGAVEAEIRSRLEEVESGDVTLGEDADEAQTRDE